MLVQKFKLSGSVMTKIHYFFQSSVETGVRKTFHLKESQIITHKEETTSTIEWGSSETTTGGSTTTITTEFSSVERKILMLLVQGHLHTIN